MSWFKKTKGAPKRDEQPQPFRLQGGYPEEVSVTDASDQLARALLGQAQKLLQGRPAGSKVDVQIPPGHTQIHFVALAASVDLLASEYGLVFDGQAHNTLTFAKS